MGLLRLLARTSQISDKFVNLSNRSAAFQGTRAGIACSSRVPQRQRWAAGGYGAVGRKEHEADPRLYDHVYSHSQIMPEEFWAQEADNITWFKQPDVILDNSNPPYTKWFSGGYLNVCYNALDRNLHRGLADTNALIHDSPVTGTVSKITYKELHDQVTKLAGALSKHGVQYGDRVLIYMPMIPQAVMTMLACSRLGAPHSLVFGGFASKELSTRINHAEPKVIVTANCGMEPNRVVEYKPLLDEAINLSDHKPQKVFVYQRPEDVFSPASMEDGRDLDFREELEKARPHDCVPVESNHPLYLLYTSGTTGTPKGVVRPSGGHAVMLNWSMFNIYGMRPKEVWFAASDLGWVVGHSYICYAPLLHGNTSVIYEGKPIGTPDPGKFFQMIQDHHIAGMFTAPTALRAIRREDPRGHFADKYSYKHFRYLFVAGEHCDPETMEWCQEVFRSPVLDNWWQTETGSAMTSTCVGLGNHLYPIPGVAGKPVPGWNIKVVDNDMKEVGADELGNIVVQLPLPPGAFSSLYNADERFMNTYFTKFPGYYDTADAGYLDKDGNIAVMARSDDVINVAGHRLSTGQLEEAMLQHPDVVEVAVIGRPDELKGQVPLGLIVLKQGVQKSEEDVIGEVIEVVRHHVGPVAAFKQAVIVNRLPKTRSGKVARSTIASMVAGKPYKIPVTIEDANVYPELVAIFEKNGIIEEKDPSERVYEIDDQL